MSHRTQPIPAVVEYQRLVGLPVTIPVVVEEYNPRRTPGWRPSTWSKHISRSYARRLKREGVTSVALAIAPGRVADFTIDELTRV